MAYKPLFFVCRNRIHISVHPSRNQRVARNVAGNHSSGGEESPLTISAGTISEDEELQ